MSALTRDPLRVVRDALDRDDCDPRGPDHKYTARCPAHEDRSPSLSVGEGVDGRVLLHCFAGCPTADIVRALELGWPDLFPPGHHHARPVAVLAKPRAAIDMVLQALREHEIAYRATRDADMWVADACPACGRDEGLPLWIQQDAGRVRLACMDGCEQTAVLAALTEEPS